MEKHEETVEKKHIPIGLISGNVTANQDINEGEFLTEDNVSLDTNTTVWKLRKLQDQTFK